MSRIAVSCCAHLTDDERRFMRLVQSRLAELGHEFILVATQRYEEFAHVTLPLPDRDAWRSSLCIDLPADPEELRMIDATVWMRRLQHLVGDPQGTRDCRPLLGNMIAGSVRVLRSLQPGLFVAWNPADPMTGVLSQVARGLGIPTSAFERGLLPATMNIDPQYFGIHNSLVAVPFDEIPWSKPLPQMRETGRARIHSAFQEEFARYSTTARAALLDYLATSRWAAERPRVLVLGILDISCGIAPGDPERDRTLPGFQSGFELAQRVAESHTGVTLFKPHPGMESRAASFDTRSVPDLFVGTGHPRDYLQWADVVVSYGSTLEYAALAMDRPLVLAGRTSLFGKGIAYEALEVSQLPAAIDAAWRRVDFEDRKERFEALVGYLTEDYLVTVDSEAERQRGADRWCEEMHRLALSVVPDKPFETVRREILGDGPLHHWDRVGALERDLASTHAELARRQAEIERLHAETVQHKVEIASLSEQLARQEAAIAQSEAERTCFERQLARQKAAIAQSEAERTCFERQLALIEGTRTWRMRNKVLSAVSHLHLRKAG